MNGIEKNIRPSGAPSVNSDVMSRAAKGARQPGLYSKRRRDWRWIVGIVATVVVLVVAAGYYFVLRPRLMINGTYQAVFLTNGQVYFGRLQSIDGAYVKMSNVYYTQGKATDASAEGTAGTGAVELIKLTSAVHGPKDEIVLNNNQILFFENLDNEGQAAKLMESDQLKK